MEFTCIHDRISAALRRAISERRVHAFHRHRRSGSKWRRRQNRQDARRKEGGFCVEAFVPLCTAQELGAQKPRKSLEAHDVVHFHHAGVGHGISKLQRDERLPRPAVTVQDAWFTTRDLQTRRPIP